MSRHQYVLLPSEGIRAGSGPARTILQSLTPGPSGLEALGTGVSAALPPGQSMEVIDAVQETGAKLIEMDATAADAINASQVPLRAVPVVEYPRPRIFPRATQVRAAATATGLQSITVTCRNPASGGPVPGARVIGFSDFANRIGDGDASDANGEARLRLSGPRIERLYVYPPANHWGAYRENLPVANHDVDLVPVNLSYVDCVRHYFGASRFDATVGVTVGILDSGCGPHADLNLQPGCATVTGEPTNDASDYDIHGTHVAGLVGASGGLRGVAPGVAIRPYRVFPMNGDGATNYAILKALFIAATDQCDIVNLSLGGGPFDYVVEEAIDDARNQGMLVIVAAGNDDRSAVSYPAAHRGALAVSAMGREGTFPPGSLEHGDIVRPPNSPDAAEFLAGFSNVGPEIAVTAPGVGTLSTLPNGNYGPLSGTSMAAPVTAGAAASLLSQNPAVFGMPRNRARSDAIYNLLVQNCVRRRFGQVFEGFGMPDPAVV